jgi:hypothetical protein
MQQFIEWEWQAQPGACGQGAWGPESFAQERQALQRTIVQLQKSNPTA